VTNLFFTLQWFRLASIGCFVFFGGGVYDNDVPWHIIASIPCLVSKQCVIFVCQLTEVLQNVLGDQFLGIYSIMFSPGSVLVNSIVHLSSPPSDSDISNIEAGLTYTFTHSGFVVDQISLKEKKGNKQSVHTGSNRQGV